MGYALRAADKPEDIVYPSPNGKWEVRSAWISNDYRRDIKVINRETGKSYFGLQGTPSENAVGAKHIDVLWSPDSRFAAITVTYGRIARDHYLVAIQNGIPEDLGEAWETAAPEKWPACLLKEKDKKRWMHAWQSTDSDGVSFVEWINNRDFSITMQFCTTLRATMKEPQERLRAIAKITLRMDEKGRARIIASKYEKYEKTIQGTPADWDQQEEKENRGLPLWKHGSDLETQGLHKQVLKNQRRAERRCVDFQ